MYKGEINLDLRAEYLADLIKAQFEGRNPGSIPDGVDLDEMYHMAINNHMEYLILGALLKSDNLEERYKDSFRRRVMHSIIKTATQISEMKELQKRCEDNGIVNQPMKGARLKYIYPSPEMREMSDVDILIHADSMNKAQEQLQEMGYILERSIKHHDVYYKNPYMVIEAHKSMYDKTVDNNQYQYFSDMSKAVLLDGCKYTYDFNVNDFYIYMIAHMAKHFYVMGCGIRNLLDIYVYICKNGDRIDRSYIDGELTKLGLQVFEDKMRKLAFAWMEDRSFSVFQQNLFDYMLGSGIYGKDENGIWSKFAEKKMQGKKISRSLLRLWYFFPPISYMAEYYSWLDEKPYLLPVAWGIRAFRGIFLKKGRDKREMIHEIKQEQIAVYQDIYQAMQLHFTWKDTKE